jgi:Protein of unknown function (DUF3892)
MVNITEVHMSGGAEHQHIASVRWKNPQDLSTGESTRSVMVDWIKNKGGDARARDSAGTEAQVGVVEGRPPYIRTWADKVWTDNLLALPRY